MVRVICEEPAKLSRLSHRKGKIAVGMDADFVLWDPEEAVVVKANFLKFSYFCIMLTSLSVKVMLHGTIRNSEFWRNTALQFWNHVVTIQNNVATMSGNKSLLRIVVG